MSTNLPYFAQSPFDIGQVDCCRWHLLPAMGLPLRKRVTFPSSLDVI